MDRVVDLDELAGRIEDRRQCWRATGLAVRPVTWRDASVAWPRELALDRGQVSDPDSLGVRLLGPADSELVVVVFRGGWADVDYVVPDGAAVETHHAEVASADAAAELLDKLIDRVWASSA